jgi:hypothetical protein
MKKTTLIASLLTLSAFLPRPTAAAQQTDSLVWFDGQRPVSYHLESPTDPVVTTALQMFTQDLLQVTGYAPAAVRQRQATVQVLQLDRATRTQRTRFERAGIRVDTLLTTPDAFHIVAHDGRLWVAGSNGRGVAYALLELSCLAGVSPWVWWGDVTPQPRTRLTAAAGTNILELPAVTYRGIFINDEDWSTQPWSHLTFDPSPTPGLISARTYREIFKLLLRLRGNFIWPAMHGTSVPFYQVPGARAMADSCGIVVGTSHCEPLMRNNVSEWDVARRGSYNYITNRDSVLHYWTERLLTTGTDENVYTIGMRGIHDGPMEGVKGLDAQTTALQQVIDDQRELLRRYVNPDVTQVPQAFVPYKEVLQVMEHGLNVPDDVTLVWCDDNYGYITRLPDSLQQQRSGGGGLYYHLSYWGRPHDYLWLTCTQPGLISHELLTAYAHNVRKLWVANVHDPKVAAYDLQLFMDLAWRGQAAPLDSVMASWSEDIFGAELQPAVTALLQEHYRLTALRRPEFMGWCQNELDKKVYPRGLSPVSDTEFSFTAFGNEADRYLARCRAQRQRALQLRDSIPARLRDAYFSLILYPICAAADMSIKQLEAQRARTLAADTLCADGSTRNLTPQQQRAIGEACRRSLEAHREIGSLTAYYNDTLAGGKWCHLMDDHPRRQLVFDAPTLPDESLYASEGGTAEVFEPQQDSFDVAPRDSTYTARTAASYDRMEGAAPMLIDQLGHSSRAVATPAGTALTYEFDARMSGDATLTVALIPTHPLDRGDLRFSIRIDDGEEQVCSIREGFRTEPWKQNVLRGQVLRRVPVTLTAGAHRLMLRALDDNIVFDEWIVDFVQERKYYVIPTE